METVKQSVIQLRIELEKFNSIEEIMAYPLTVCVYARYAKR